jgi:hypothetical protein
MKECVLEKSLDKTQKKIKLAIIFSYSLITIGIIYIFVVIWGISTQNPITNEIQNNIRIIMEILTAFSSMLLFLLTLSIHFLIDEDNHFYSILSIVFMSASMVVTLCVHFISITLSDELIMANQFFKYLLSLEWPSVLYALDIVAWDIFFGLSFVALGIGFILSKYDKLTGILMIASGFLSLSGIAAIPARVMEIRFIGVFGYTVLPVAVCIFFIKSLRKRLRSSSIIY